jgi:membrane protein
MPERRLIWPLLAYGALSVIAFARQGERGLGRAPPAPRPQRVSDRSRVKEAERLGEPLCGQASGDTRGSEHRAQERGRGRHATAPWRIPRRGWKDILWRTYDKINDNRLMAVAAGAVFYSLLALFPAIAAFVSLYGLFADPSTIDSTLSTLSGVLPGGAMDLVHEELKRLAANKGANLSIGFVVSVLFALWSANSGMKAIIDALNVAYDEKEKRSFIRLNLVSLLYTLIAMVSLMLAIGAVVVAPIVLNTMGLGGVGGTLIAVLRWPLLIALVVIGLAAAYRFLPCRREPRWQWLSVGSVTAAVLWLVGSLLFSWYIANFGTYNVTYGSLGAAVGMMMWMWISMLVILVGAQLNAEIEHQTARDSTVDGEKPLGQRGAVEADTIGAARN